MHRGRSSIERANAIKRKLEQIAAEKPKIEELRAKIASSKGSEENAEQEKLERRALHGLITGNRNGNLLDATEINIAIKRLQTTNKVKTKRGDAGDAIELPCSVLKSEDGYIIAVSPVVLGAGSFARAKLAQILAKQKPDGSFTPVEPRWVCAKMQSIGPDQEVLEELVAKEVEISKEVGLTITTVAQTQDYSATASRDSSVYSASGDSDVFPAATYASEAPSPTSSIGSSSSAKSSKSRSIQKLASGEELFNTLAKGSFNDAEAIRAALAVTRAVFELNNSGTLHRDIKPENLIYDSKKGEATLIDFGFAIKLNGKTAIRDKQAMGTPDFLAPECIEKKVYSSSSEAFAVGKVIKEIAESSSLSSEVSESLLGTAESLTAENPDDRIHNAEALAFLTTLAEEHSALNKEQAMLNQASLKRAMPIIESKAGQHFAIDDIKTKLENIILNKLSSGSLDEVQASMLTTVIDELDELTAAQKDKNVFNKKLGDFAEFLGGALVMPDFAENLTKYPEIDKILSNALEQCTQYLARLNTDIEEDYTARTTGHKDMSAGRSGILYSKAHKTAETIKHSSSTEDDTMSKDKDFTERQEGMRSARTKSAIRRLI